MNRELFTKLVRKELSGLRRFLLAACSGNGDEADDVAQEALMKASFEDEAGFSAWLYKIACNCLIDHQRKLTTRGVTLDIDKANDVAASSHTDDAFHYQDLYHIDKANDVAASSHTDDAFAYQGLYHAIEGLGMSERTAVLLFYITINPDRYERPRTKRHISCLSP